MDHSMINIRQCTYAHMDGVGGGGTVMRHARVGVGEHHGREGEQRGLRA